MDVNCRCASVKLKEKIETNPNLKTQYDVFEREKDEDADEFHSRFENIRVDMDDIQDCFEVLKNLTLDTPSEPYFLSILQHLLFIRDDIYIRWVNFDLFNSQICAANTNLLPQKSSIVSFSWILIFRDEILFLLNVNLYISRTVVWWFQSNSKISICYNVIFKLQLLHTSQPLFRVPIKLKNVTCKLLRYKFVCLIHFCFHFHGNKITV